MEQYEQLTRSCITGNRKARSSLYEHFAPKMFGVCLRYAESREETEEIMHEGFIQVFGSVANFKHAGCFEGWIRKIMVYDAIHHYRSRLKVIIGMQQANFGHDDLSGEETLARIKKYLFQCPRWCCCELQNCHKNFHQF